MDGEAFDSLARLLAGAPTRRQVLGVLAAFAGTRRARAASADSRPAAVGRECVSDLDCGSDSDLVCTDNGTGMPQARCCLELEGETCQADSDCCGTLVCAFLSSTAKCMNKGYWETGVGGRCAEDQQCSQWLGGMTTCGQIGRESKCCQREGFEFGPQPGLPGQGRASWDDLCCDGTVQVRGPSPMVSAGIDRYRCIAFDAEANLPDAVDAATARLPDGWSAPGAIGRDLGEVVAAFSDPLATRTLFETLGWSGNAAATATGPDGAGLYLSVHRFGSGPEAGVALDHVVGDATASDDLASAEFGTGDTACLARDPAESGGTWVMLEPSPTASEPARRSAMARRGPYVVVAVTSGPSGSACERIGLGVDSAGALFRALGMLPDGVSLEAPAAKANATGSLPGERCETVAECDASDGAISCADNGVGDWQQPRCCRDEGGSCSSSSDCCGALACTWNEDPPVCRPKSTELPY